MKHFNIIILVSCLMFIISCEKEDDLNKLPSIPELVSPQNSAVVNSESIFFDWNESIDKESDRIVYILSYGDDLSNMLSYITTFETEYELTANLEKGKKHYWKVEAENYIPGIIPKIENGKSISDVRYFYTEPPGVKELSDSSAHEYIALTWKNPDDVDQLEITFEPEVTGISQPIVLGFDIEKLELSGMQNGTIYLFSVKVIASSGHVSAPTLIRSLPHYPNQIIDADFNIYNIIVIGDQTWMKENLRTTKWADGTSMFDLVDRAGIASIYVNSDTSEVYYRVAAAIGDFNGHEGGKKLCPCNYHVSTDNDWRELERHLGMPDAEVDTIYGGYRGVNEKVGNILKSSTGWYSSGNGTDILHFSALPSGQYYQGEIVKLGTEAIFWSVIKSDIWTDSRIRKLSYDNDGIAFYYTVGGPIPYSIGNSIRCVKD